MQKSPSNWSPIKFSNEKSPISPSVSIAVVKPPRLIAHEKSFEPPLNNPFIPVPSVPIGTSYIRYISHDTWEEMRLSDVFYIDLIRDKNGVCIWNDLKGSKCENGTLKSGTCARCSSNQDDPAKITAFAFGKADMVGTGGMIEIHLIRMKYVYLDYRCRTTGLHPESCRNMCERKNDTMALNKLVKISAWYRPIHLHTIINNVSKKQ